MKQDRVLQIQVRIYEHETFLNEQKRLISLISPGLVELIVDKFEDVVSYAPHQELDLSGAKKSPNSTTTRFVNNKSYRTSGSVASALGQAVTSFDYGPTIGLQVAALTGSGDAATAAATTTAATTTVTTAASSTGGSGSSGSSSSGSSGSSGGGGGY